MAKVTLLTSREISKCFNLQKFIKLSYSVSYITAYKVKGEDIEYGIAYHTDKEKINEIFQKQINDEQKVHEVAKLVKLYKGPVGDFDAQVYMFPDEEKNHNYYIAREYPYDEDEETAKYEYLNGIMEIIFNKEEKNPDEFNVYAHDMDFCFNFDANDFDKEGCTGDVNKDEIEDIEDYKFLNKLFNEFIGVNPPKGKIKLFQHDRSFPRIIKTFPKTILKLQQ